MKIKFFPQRRNDTLTIIKDGDSLTVNDQVLDFSALADGESLPVFDPESELPPVPPHLLVQRVDRIDGELVVHVILPHGPNPPGHVAYPTDLNGVQNGEVPVPVAPAPEPESEEEEPPQPGE